MLLVHLYRKAESLYNTGAITVTEMLNEITNSNSNQASGNSEPLLVGTNTTLNYEASGNNNLTYDTENQPLAVGTNLTIKINYAEAELLSEQLGISLDGSDNYLGSNITVIGGDRDWLERIDGNPANGQGMPSSTTNNSDDSYIWDLEEPYENTTYDSENEGGLATEADFFSDSNEPLLVGTNITFIIEEDTNLSSEKTENEGLSARDGQTPFALGTNLLLELPNDGQQDNYLGNNLSTIIADSETQTSAMEGDSFGGMISTEEANQPQSDNGDYAWDFNSQADTTNNSGGTGEDLNSDALFAASPWGALEETGAVDGFEDVFANGAGEIDNLAGGFGGGEI